MKCKCKFVKAIFLQFCHYFLSFRKAHVFIYPFHNHLTYFSESLIQFAMSSASKEFRLLRLRFLANLMSVYDVRNHLLVLESVYSSLLGIIVSTVLEGQRDSIIEVGYLFSIFSELFLPWRPEKSPFYF